MIYFIYIFHSINLLAPVSTHDVMSLAWSAGEQGFCNAVHMVHEGIMRSALVKHYSCQTFVKTDGYKLKYLFPAQPSPFPRHNGKCIICSFNKEIKLFEGCFSIIPLNLVLPSEMTKGRKHCVVKSINFDQFMTSEGTKTLILAFTSKTGQPVEHTRHRIYLFGFFCQTGDI